MHFLRGFACSVFAWVAVNSAVVLAAEPLRLVSAKGAVATFTESDGAWRLSSIVPPAAGDGHAIEELGCAIVSSAGSETGEESGGWVLAGYTEREATFERDFPVAALRLRRVYAFGPADNILRIAIAAQSTAASNTLDHIALLRARFAGSSFHETGNAPASFPLFSRDLFVGIEHVSGECHADEDVLEAAQSPHLALDGNWTTVATVVIGWTMPDLDRAPGESAIRAAFLHYLDSVRIVPADLELHTNTWWTLPLPFSEQDVLNDIQALREGFYDRTGMFFDSYALDLGWSDRHSIWEFDEQRFPNGLRAINEELAKMGCRPGLWISPGSAYPEGLDNAWLKGRGYEVTPAEIRSGWAACFALGGRYQQEVKANLVRQAREYGLGHVKLDFMLHACDAEEHGHPTDPAGSAYAIDAGLADVLDSLRAVNPKMALEPLVCGHPPSPWWTMHTPFLLGPNGDDVPYGRVPALDWTESLITARDIAYRSEQEKWLMPTQSLETFDIVVQSPGNFENMAVMAIGRGRWFISTYLKPDYVSPHDWDFLAALVRWARANKASLVNAQMFGGDPALRQPYGYLFHSADRDIYCVRNPWIESQTIELPRAATDARDLRMLYPRHATIAQMGEGDEPTTITLAPYETVMLETIPAGSMGASMPPSSDPVATVASNGPRWETGGDGTSHFIWDGTVDLPAGVTGQELCIAVNGDAEVKDATAVVTATGVRAPSVKSVSAGQFAAAADGPVEHWTWFRLPVTAGHRSIHVDVRVPLSHAGVGIYLHGGVGVARDSSPQAKPAFPESANLQRGWSQTLATQFDYPIVTADE